MHCYQNLSFSRQNHSLQSGNLHALTTSSIGISHARPNRFGVRAGRESTKPNTLRRRRRNHVKHELIDGCHASLHNTFHVRVRDRAGIDYMAFLLCALKTVWHSVTDCGMALRFDLPSLLGGFSFSVSRRRYLPHSYNGCSCLPPPLAVLASSLQILD